MKDYKNLSEKSNVSKYRIGENFIDVEFKTKNKDGFNTYKYSYNSTGQNNVDQMKELAESGLGLNSFIMNHVKKLYESKW